MHLTFILPFYLVGIFVNSQSTLITNGNPRSSSRISLPNQIQMDDNGNYIMAWELNPTTQEITFEVEARTNGFVGFGISPHGNMQNADIFIGGVNPNGIPYYSDRIGIGPTTPQLDDHEDWTLLQAEESDGFTYLKFSRPINSCDEQDYPINNDTNRLIWSTGDTDDFLYHNMNRGTRSTNLLGAPTPPMDLDKLNVWEMRTDTQMPTETSSYWCSFYKGPLLSTKHHVVAVDAFLDNPEALKHTHHIILSNCHVSPDLPFTPEQLFANKTVDDGYPGNYCYGPSSFLIPYSFCQEYFFGWAKGGKITVFPEHVGYPISDGDTAGHQQYYMMEVHFDNPQEIKDLQFKTGLKLYYTDQLRPMDAGVLSIGHEVEPSLTVPPNTKDYVVASHCSPSCTQLFPPDGVTVFNVLLHAHLAGRNLRLRHFRGNTELPWIDYDAHFDFDFQQSHHLHEEVKILPGDQLTYECVYDSTWKNGSIISGGLRTVDEMCLAFVWYYPKQNFDKCMSETNLHSHFADFGVTKYYSDMSSGIIKYIIQEPPSLAGDYDDSISHKFNWTESFQEQFYQKHRFGGHDAKCSGTHLSQTIRIKDQKYPDNLIEYVQEDKCANSFAA